MDLKLGGWSRKAKLLSGCGGWEKTVFWWPKWKERISALGYVEKPCATWCYFKHLEHESKVLVIMFVVNWWIAKFSWKGYLQWLKHHLSLNTSDQVFSFFKSLKVELKRLEWGMRRIGTSEHWHVHGKQRKLKSLEVVTLHLGHVRNKQSMYEEANLTMDESQLIGRQKPTQMAIWGTSVELVSHHTKFMSEIV